MTEEENHKKTDNDIKSASEIQTEIVKDDKDKLSICEEKLQRALADYQNLDRRNKLEIAQKILNKTNHLMLSFIVVYEDFIRAKTALINANNNTEGLDGVIKNMENILHENNIKSINAVGEIFDPKLHEAVSTVEDNSLDEGTITKEVAKGYISSQEVIKPSKVIVSKKNESD